MPVPSAAEFTVGSKPEMVTALGYFDGPNSANGTYGDGLLQSHEVGVYTTGGSIVPGLDLIVPAGGGTLVGDFRYVDLGSPVTLAANTSYVIAGQVTTSDLNASGDVFLDQSGTQTVASAFSLVGARYTGGASGNGSFNNGLFAYPADGGNANQIYLGPNLQFTAVTPEPSALVLCGLGALGLLLAARRRRKA